MQVVPQPDIVYVELFDGCAGNQLPQKGKPQGAISDRQLLEGATVLGNKAAVFSCDSAIQAPLGLCAQDRQPLQALQTF